jgi:hypothetical protein
MTHDQARDLAAGYVLGALERSEEAAVRDHLATCTEPHPEFEALGGVVPALLELEDLELVQPPAAIGDRIMAAAAADRIMAAAAADLAERQEAPAPAAAVPRTDVPSPAGTSPAVPSAPPPSPPSPAFAPLAFPTEAQRMARSERTRTGRFDWALRVAAVIAIVAVGAWGMNLQGELDAARRYDKAVAAVVQAAGQPGAKPVVLTAAAGSTASGIGALRPDGSVVLAMRDLPATSGSQVYEAWVIVGSAAPVAVGGFTVDPRGTASFTTRPATTPPGAVIALTLEPKEGNTTPQGPIVSSGVALAQPTGQGGRAGA